MTFGAHRGADQGAGRVTSGRDLLRQLRGSTSASPPSTAGLLQLPGLTSTRPGRHSVVPDLHQHFWAGIFFLGPAYLCPSQHIYVPADICGAGVDSDISLAGIYSFWPELTSACRIISISAYSGQNMQVLGRRSKIPAGMGRHGRSPLRGRASLSGWAGSSFISAGPSRPRCSYSVGPSQPSLWVASAGCPGWASIPAL
jgi:hypothetical protein